MLHEYLSYGQENAIPARDLAEILQCSKRDIVRQVEKERRDGIPICASCDPANNGYYLAENEQELENYCESLKGRAIELFKTRQALIKVLKQLRQENASG